MKNLAAVGAVVWAVTGSLLPAVAAETEDLLKQAAQHFVDLEDDKAKAILEELSAEGVTDADVLLGYLYSDPLYKARDYRTAISYFERAVGKDDPEAVFQHAESRFWPDYSNWTLSADEEAIRPTAEEAFVLLQQVEGKGQYATRWRIPYLCIFGGYDCDEETTDKALKGITRYLVLGNLRTIRGVFRIVEIQRSGEADTPENAEALAAYFALGMAAADPFVAALVSEPAWLGLGSAGHCPDPVSLDAAGRLLALEGGAVAASDGWAGFERCFDVQQAAAVREDLVSSLDKLARAYNNQNTWHLQTCYQSPEAPTFGSCLVHAVRHHYFACTKLSMIDYFRQRFEIYYATSARYARCREHMLSARGG